MPIVCSGAALGVPGTDAVFGSLDEADLGKALFDAKKTLIGKLDDGIVDALFGFTRAVSGGYYFCPPVAGGRLDLRALGL